MSSRVDGWSGVGIRVRDFTAVVALPEIRAVERIESSTPVPGSAPAVIGMIELRGRTLVLLDLGLMLLGQAGEPGAARAALLVDWNAEPTALAIDRCLGLRRFSAHREPLSDQQITDLPSHIVDAARDTQGTLWPIVALEGLLAGGTDECPS